MEISLESRHCKGCGLTFRCSTKSLQKYHSKECENSGRTWKEKRLERSRQRLSAAILRGQEPPVDPVTRPQIFYRKPGQDSIQLNVSAAKERGITLEKESIITSTKQNVTKKENNANNETQKPQMPISENIMLETKNNAEKLSTKERPDETPQEGSLLLSDNLNAESFHSMKLLDSTANELFSLMKGLNKNLPTNDDGPVMLHDVDRVRVAAECGKQIISTMRMKLDVLKFAKELRDIK